jgi:3-deoxy-D-manno-octulosonic-acid transferase
MRTLYNILIQITTFHLWFVQLFSSKMQLFVQGRKKVFSTLKNSISKNDKTIWFHCASLGEYEQGFPIMEEVKKQYPDYKLIISFFSPSGFEIKKNTPIADAVVYLPMDTISNAKKFIDLAHPSLVLFVKYEFWPNYLLELKKREIPTLLISGLFRENQLFFKFYGSFMRTALRSFHHIFVQDENSKNLLHNIHIENVTVAGDTRFDRVSNQIKMNNSLPFIESFKGNSICIVCGSTWPEDELTLINYINEAPINVKFIIAPHKIEAQKIENLRSKIETKSILFSEKEGENLFNYSVLIIDTIGLLTKIYSYADIAYVGGAMGSTGLHNILEPATFGIPIVIGKNFENFPEAKLLRQLAGLYSISNPEECTQILKKLIDDPAFRNKTGIICGHFVNKNTGATNKTMSYIENLDSKGLI